jgi:hypothetical protein
MADGKSIRAATLRRFYGNPYVVPADRIKI